jgi:predicted nucleic acid-binding protein
VKIILDSSVLLAASGSETGASREIFRRRIANEWELIATAYVIAEVEQNLPKLDPSAQLDWPELKNQLRVKEDVLAAPNIVIFQAGKDRPVLFSGLAYADWLLTLDMRDFEEALGPRFYGLPITRPGEFLRQQREQGLLK